MKVYEAINNVTAALAKTGISKDRRNSQGSGYMFRGIDDVYGALAPLLAAHGLCILPRVISREVKEQTSRSGGLLFYTVLLVEFDFVAKEDWSKHTVCTIGEAMDSGDKSTNKAMSAAYKYACFLAFCIPTEGDNDADASTHAVQSDESVILNVIAGLEGAGTLAEAQDIYVKGVGRFKESPEALVRIREAKDAAKARLQKVAA